MAVASMSPFVSHRSPSLSSHGVNHSCTRSERFQLRDLNSSFSPTRIKTKPSDDRLILWPDSQHRNWMTYFSATAPLISLNEGTLASSAVQTLHKDTRKK